jgi:hypothetical protein
MRPIDAIKYGENLVWLIGHGEFSSPQDALRRALYVLAQTPTLTLDDLRPKGRWERDENGKVRCSVCKKKALEAKSGVWYVPNFCYNCGADMRGGGEDE